MPMWKQVRKIQSAKGAEGNAPAFTPLRTGTAQSTENPFTLNAPAHFHAHALAPTHNS